MTGYQLSKAFRRYLETFSETSYLPGTISTLAGYWDEVCAVAVPRLIELGDGNALVQLSNKTRNTVNEAIAYIRDLSPSLIFPDALTLRGSIEEILNSFEPRTVMPLGRVP